MKMIKLTLDTSCFDKKSIPLLYELAKFQKNGLVDVRHEPYSESEKERWVNPDKEKIIALFHEFSKFKSDACSIPINIIDNPKKSYVFVEKQRGYTFKKSHEIHTKIDQLTYPEGFLGRKNINKYIDNKILALHIVRGRDMFLTKDKMLFRKDQKYKLIEKEFPNIKIRLLNEESVRELKELVNG